MIAGDLIDRARTVRIEDEIERHGIKLAGKTERCGQCPQCGGTDRFNINVRKQVFLCRGCDAKGDVIALTQFLDGLVWEEPIRRFVAGLERVTVADVACTALGIDVGKITMGDQKRIAGALTAIGWTASRTKAERFWIPTLVTGDTW
jgi:hypothetical protein